MLLPLWTSVLVRTYAWMVLLGRNGVFNRWLIDAGVIADPLPLLNNFTGVLIGMVHVLLPYMVLPIYGAVRRLDPALVAAAEGLGASNWRIFWRIYLPLTLHGIFAGVDARLRAVARLLHHPGAAGRRPGDDDRRADRAAGAPDAELAVCRGAVGRAAGAHPRRLCAGAALHAAQEARAHEPAACSLAAPARLIYFFLMLPLLVVFPISFSSAPYLQFPPPGCRCSGTSATSTIRNGSMPPALRSISAPRPRCWRWRWACRSPSAWRAAGSPAASLVDRLALAPLIVPTIILSVAVYGLFAKLKLIGEWYGLVVAHTVLALPFVVLVMVAGLRDFDVGWSRRRRGWAPAACARCCAVTLPLLRPSLVSAGLLAFISLVRRAGGGAVPGRRQHDAAQEDVRQHHDGDRSDDRRGVGDADPAGLCRAVLIGRFGARACSGSAR